MLVPTNSASPSRKIRRRPNDGLAALKEAFEFVGVASAARFWRVAVLVLGYGAADHRGDGFGERPDLIGGDGLIRGCGDVPLGQVRQVGGAGLLGVVPQREEGSPVRVSAFRGGETEAITLARKECSATDSGTGMPARDQPVRTYRFSSPLSYRNPVISRDSPVTLPPFSSVVGRPRRQPTMRLAAHQAPVSG
jgi:hypothetical protein